MSNKRITENRAFAKRVHKQPLPRGDFNALLRRRFPGQNLDIKVAPPKRNTYYSGAPSDAQPSAEAYSWGNRFFELIERAFLRAQLRATHSELENGPNWQERADRLRKIADHAGKLFEALTGSDMGREHSNHELSNPGLSNHIFVSFENERQADLVNSLVDSLPTFWAVTKSAEASARELHSDEVVDQKIEKALDQLGLNSTSQTPESRDRRPRHRPIGSGDHFRNFLILELAEAWQAATELSVPHDAAHPFFGFVEAYFEGDAEYAAATVCRQLRALKGPPAR